MNAWQMIDGIGQRRLDRARLKLERARISAQRPLNVRLLANVIGVALVSGFLGALFALFVIPIPTANEQIITYMVGQLSGFAGGVVAYHYTMTAGQKEKEAQQSHLDAKRADTTGKAIEGLSAAVAAVTGTTAPEAKADVELQPGETARAATPEEIDP